MSGLCQSCGKRLGRGNTSGLCKADQLAKINADPAVQARRLDRLRASAKDPALIATRLANLREAMKRPEVIASRRERGKEQAKLLHQPEVFARSQTPDARARAGRARTERVLGWCPPHLRDEYRHLVRCKRIPAAEARQIIELQIPGSEEHARREVANNIDKQRIRHARQIREAY